MSRTGSSDALFDTSYDLMRNPDVEMEPNFPLQPGQVSRRCPAKETQHGSLGRTVRPGPLGAGQA